MYGPNAWFVKVTLLLVVIRVFNINRSFVLFWYAFIVAMAGYYVPVLFIKMNICHPINSYWDASIPAKCLDQRAIFVADTVVSAVTDLAVLLAPVPVIMALTMSFKQKVRVYLLLGAGGVATIASFIRQVLISPSFVLPFSSRLIHPWGYYLKHSSLPRSLPSSWTSLSTCLTETTH